MKGKLPDDKLASLTEAYFQTYGSHAVADGNYPDAIM